MFQRLHELSEIIGEGEPLWKKLNEGMPQNYTRGLAICFDKDGEFVGMRNWSRRKEVLYRSGPPNGHDLTACSKFGGDLKKTIPRLGRAARAATAHTVNGRHAWWCAVADALENPDAAMLERAQTALDAAELDKDNRPFLFVARFDGLTIDPTFHWPESLAALEAGFASTLGKESKSAKGTCQICSKTNGPVFGNFNVLACYNLNMPGSIAGGFDPKRAVRNFPICAECAGGLGQAIIYADTNLRGWAAGLSYYVLPSTSSPELRDYLLEDTERAYGRLRISSAQDPLDDTERNLLSYAAELANEGRSADLSLHFVFFEQVKASWKITAEVRQVSPSRMAALHAAVHDLRRDPLLAGGSAKEPKPFSLNTGLLADFSSTSAKRDPRQLRGWLVALLEGRTIERDSFYHVVTGALLARTRKDPQYSETSARRAWGVVRFALKTGLIDAKEVPMRPETPLSSYGAYCAEHSDFFAGQEHIAAFLSGCFANVVCYVQKKERGAAPFAKKFRGRLVDATLLRRLYHEGRDRLEIYNGMGLVHDLDADLAEALVAVGNDWKASPDELTLAFTVGLALQFRLQQRKSEEQTTTDGEASSGEDRK